MTKLSKWWKKINTVDLPLKNYSVTLQERLTKEYVGTHYTVESLSFKRDLIYTIWKNNESIAVFSGKNILIEIKEIQ